LPENPFLLPRRVSSETDFGIQFRAVLSVMEKWCCDRPVVVCSEVEVGEGHIPAYERRIKGFTFFQLRRGSPRETGSIDAEPNIFLKKESV